MKKLFWVCAFLMLFFLSSCSFNKTETQQSNSMVNTATTSSANISIAFPIDYHKLLALCYIEYYNEDSKMVEKLYSNSFQNTDDYGRATLPDGNVVEGPFGFGVHANTDLEIDFQAGLGLFASGATHPVIFELVNENGKYYLVNTSNEWKYELQYTEDEIVIFDFYLRLPKYHYN